MSSVGSRGDSYDNALAETVNGLYKAELIGRNRPWRSVEQVELATARWVTWWNAERLHGACGTSRPPSSRPHTIAYARPAKPRESNHGSLHETQYGSVGDREIPHLDRPKLDRIAVDRAGGPSSFVTVVQG